VKAAPFAYVRAHDTASVFDVLAAHGDTARILAGGQSLIASLNLRLAEPAVLVDITHLPGLAGIAVADGVVTIGALTRHVAVQRSPEIARHLPLLAQAVPHIAHPAIRNRGTIGGSLALNDPAAEYPACALALRATLRVRGRSGVRRVAAIDFFRGVYATALAADELLEAVEFPIARPGERSVFMELARRRGDYAMVGLAVHGRFADARARDLRCVFFGVGAGPTEAPRAAEAASTRDLPHGIRDAQEALAADLDPHGDLNASPATRLHLARVLLGRALAQFAA
jgi:carbon-monoxide dehydrogenase medium subunit